MQVDKGQGVPKSYNAVEIKVSSSSCACVVVYQLVAPSTSG